MVPDIAEKPRMMPKSAEQPAEWSAARHAEGL